jgi:hypothetical protein
MQSLSIEQPEDVVAWDQQMDLLFWNMSQTKEGDGQNFDVLQLAR